jgi:ATP-binding cassette subfamily B protein
VSPIGRLLRYVRPYRTAFAIGLLCVLLTQGVALTGPLVLQAAIDDLATGVTERKLVLYAGILLGVGLVRGYFQFLMRQVLIGASRKIEYDVRNDFFAHLQTLPRAFFQTHRTGDLMSRATNDLNAVRMMVGPSVMYAANTVLVFVVALALMVAIDARLTVWALVPLPFVSLSVKFFGSAIHRRFERIQAQLSEMSAVAQEALSGVRVVRAYRQEETEMDRFRQANLEYLRRNRRLIVLQGFFFPSMSFFLGVSAMLVLWLGSRDVMAGRLTLGEFVAFNAYLTMLAWPMIAFGWVTNMLQRGMASWKRMLEVLDTRAAIADEPSAAAPAAPISGEIEIRDLSFSFGAGPPVLSDVSARVPAGSTVAIVGPTGSGKSTLIQLLARVYDPPQGTIFIDGIDVRDLPLGVLRGAIGLVPQEPFLFTDTVADNVAFGLDARLAEALPAPKDGSAGAVVRGVAGAGVSGGGRVPDGPPAEEEDAGRMQTIVHAASVARLDKDVRDFPQGYATRVGERGVTLSGGQKQRTAIARAVATDPPILILDDALSAVDTYTEAEILGRLREAMAERTAIVVAHRISTVKDADHILVLDAGRVVERGTHDELVGREGVYAAMHRRQLLEEELAAS